MASASSSAARTLIREKSVASLLLRGCVPALTENTGPAIRSPILLNRRLPSQHPVFSETFPVVQPGLGSCFVRGEAVSVRRGKMEAGQGKRVVNDEGSSSSEEEEEEEGKGKGRTLLYVQEFDDGMDDDDEEFEFTDQE